jgi:uncharacterized protein (TIGR03083 family)
MTLASHVVELQEYVGAFEQSVRSLLSVMDSVPAADWSRPTDLPGWTVQDIVAHLAACERELLGDPPPPPLDVYGPHVRNEFGRHMEDGVAARRTRSASDLLAELRDALDARLPVLRATRAGDPPVRVIADEDWDTEKLLRNRAFDAWMHEQDVRRALTRPGNLDGLGAAVTQEIMLSALPILVAKRARAGPGQGVTVEVTGPVAFAVTVAVGDDGRAGLVGGAAGTAGCVAEPTAVLRTDWQTALRLLGGRMSPNDAVVEMSGDTALARRLVESLAITP